MALPHAISEQTKGKGTTASALAKWMNQVASWINRFRVLEPFALKNTGMSVELSLSPDYIAVPAPPESGTYTLISVDGTVSWESVIDCDEASP